MALTTEQRDALKDSDFAVPEGRHLPIHDRLHVGMAWKMVDRTSGLSDEQRKSARRKILRRAHELGMDTSKWHLAAMAFSAMALSFPSAAEDHPNKLPFSGILTRLDCASDKPLGGTGGKRIILPKEVAEEAVASLLGMGVDFKPNFDGHNPRSKIGLITAAEVIDDAIEISGYFYAADFPEEVQQIQAEKEKLGFSFEAQSLMQNLKADPLIVEACEFTGAAVLYKDKAAYYDTSIAANADQENEMTEQEKAQLDALTKGMDALTEAVGKIQAAAEKQITASSVLPHVATHAAACRAAADNMRTANIGMHATKGHVAVLNRMADHLEAEAATGHVPHIFRDHDYLSSYAAAEAEAERKQTIEAAAKAQTEALKPVLDLVASLQTQFKDLSTKISAEAAAANAGAQRKTFSPEVMASLKRLGLEASGDTKLSVAAFDKAAKEAGLGNVQSMALKLSLRESGALASV